MRMKTPFYKWIGPEMIWPGMPARISTFFARKRTGVGNDRPSPSESLPCPCLSCSYFQPVLPDLLDCPYQLRCCRCCLTSCSMSCLTNRRLRARLNRHLGDCLSYCGLSHCCLSYCCLSYCCLNCRRTLRAGLNRGVGGSARGPSGDRSGRSFCRSQFQDDLRDRGCSCRGHSGLDWPENEPGSRIENWAESGLNVTHSTNVWNSQSQERADWL